MLCCRKSQRPIRLQINDVLLTALAQTLARWTGERTLLLDLEGHGREEVVDGVDLSRTVGWFTTLFPVFLQLEHAYTPAAGTQVSEGAVAAHPQAGLRLWRAALSQPGHGSHRGTAGLTAGRGVFQLPGPG